MTLGIWHFIGGLAFGAVIGWMTYFILRRAQPKSLSDLSTIIGILGGATILALFDPEGPAFAGYAIGLAAGFFGYYAVYVRIVGRKAIKESLLKELGANASVIMDHEGKGKQE
jgi:hypothetical protein